MSEEREGRAEPGEGSGGGDSGAGGPGGARERINRGFNRGLGALTAFKEAIEETLSEARERGDLTTDRARQALGRAMERARDATSDARERFDFVTQQEYDALLARVERLEAHVGLSAPESEAEAGDGPPSSGEGDAAG